LNSEENVLVWLQVPQDEGDVSCTCYLTDTVNIYTEHLNTPSIQSRFNEKNPGMETDDFLDFLDKVRSALSGSNKSTISLTRQTDSCRLYITWTIDSIEYKWFFQTNVQPHQLLCQVLYLPFIQLSQHLIQTRESLIKIIHSKDLEIEDYKNNGSRLSRKNLKTRMFDREKDLQAFDDEKTQDSTADIVENPDVRKILRTISVKAFVEEKGIKEKVEPSSSKESMISDPSPAQISDNPQSEEETNSIKRIKLEKPNLSKIAQSSRFNKVNKKKKF